MNCRTDLALEAHEQAPKTLTGVGKHHFTRDGMSVDVVEVQTKEAAEILQKPPGIYITVSLAPFYSAQTLGEKEVAAVASLIQDLFPKENSLTLVVGLGNSDITPDALGPKTVAKTLVTRHVVGAIQNAGLENLQPVAALAPGVLGQTGIETQEIVASLVRQIAPSLVIVIDALAAQNIDRLGRTVQIANTGLSPGSGVLNQRKELSEKTLGVPVISIGVPTVVDARTCQTKVTDDEKTLEKISFLKEPLMVTPREIDVLIQRASQVLGLCLNKALQPGLSLEDLSALTS